MALSASLGFAGLAGNIYGYQTGAPALARRPSPPVVLVLCAARGPHHSRSTATPSAHIATTALSA